MRLRNNKYYIQSLNSACDYLDSAITRAQSCLLEEKEYDYFAINVSANNVLLRGGIMDRKLPYVHNDEFAYREYDLFFYELEKIASIPFDGYIDLKGESMELFVACLNEDIMASSIPVSSEIYNDFDTPGDDTLLIWDITSYHQKKEPKSFI